MVRKLASDNLGSIAPVVSFILLIIILGLCFGVGGVILEPLVTTSLSIDWLMFNMFLAAPIIALFILGSWLIVKAQRER